MIADGSDPRIAFGDLCQLPGCYCTADGNLTTLDLNGIGLNCSLDVINFSAFTQLQRMDLRLNNLTGNFDAAATNMASLASLQEILLDYNKDLGGTLDSNGGGICGLTEQSLEHVSISATKIGGEVPSCMFAATSSLKELFASGTQLEGELPSLADSATIQIFEMTNVPGLGGKLPALPPSLLKLNVSMNAFEGSIPELPDSLFLLDVSNNALQGSLPESFVSHPRLWYVDVRDNKLTGLPEAWMTAPDGTTMDVAEIPLRNFLAQHNMFDVRMVYM